MSVRRVPRLVATDLDGTLLRSDLTVSPRTRDAIDRVEAAGSMLVMVTGRPVRWMSAVVEATGHRGVAICANGAVVYDLHTATTLRTDLLSPQASAHVVRTLREAVEGICFATEAEDGAFGHDPDYGKLVVWDQPDKTVAPAEELVAQPLTKLLARHPSMDPDHLLAQARDVLGDAVTLTHSSRSALLEISAAGVTKATGLARMAEELGIDQADVVAFGDMPNDLPMLAWAGRSVAVANAHPEVLAAAQETTAANDDDGVAQWLEQVFSEPN